MTDKNDQKRTCVLIVDDHPLIRMAISTAIEAEDDMTVIGQCVDGQSAIDAAKSLKPDVILMDINLPVKDGLASAREIKREIPGAKILGMSSSSGEEVLLSVINAGMGGFIHKEAAPEEFIRGLREMAFNGQYLPLETAKELMEGLRRITFVSVDTVPVGALLTLREKELLDHLAEGRTNAEIATKMFLSEATVRVHIHNMIYKLELENRNQLVIFANREKKG